MANNLLKNDGRSQEVDLEQAETLLEKVIPNIEIEVFDESTVEALKGAMELFEKWEVEEKVAGVYIQWSRYEYVLGNFHSAITYCQKAIKLVSTSIIQKEELLVRAFLSIGLSYLMIGDFTAAESYLTQALEKGIEKLKKQPLLTAMCWESMGTLFFEQDRYKESFECSDKSLAILHAQENTPIFLLGEVYSNLGATYLQLQNYVESKENLIKGTNYYKEVLPPSHHKFAELYYNLSRLNKEIGDFHLANLYIQKSTKLFEQNQADSLYLAFAYHEQGVMESKLKDYPKAIESAQKARTILDDNKINTHELSIAILLSLGSYHTYIKDYTKSIFFYQEALKAIQVYDGNKSYHQFILCYGMLDSYIHSNNQSSATLYFEKIFQLIESHPNVLNNYHSSQIWLTIGHFYKYKKQYKKGLQAYHKSLTYSIKTLDAENIYDYFRFESYEDLQKIENAYDVVIANFTTKAEAFFLIYQHQSQQIKDLEAAFKNYEQIGRLAHVMRQSFQGDTSKLLISTVVQSCSKVLIEIVFRLYQLRQDDSYIHHAFKFVEQEKAYLLFQKYQEKTSTKPLQIPSQLHTTEHLLQSKLILLEKSIQVQKQKGEKGDSRLLQKWQDDYFNTFQEFNVFKKQLKQEHPDYYRQKYSAEMVTIEVIQASLQKKQTVLSYFIGKEKIHLFAITSNEYELFSSDKPNNWSTLLQGCMQSIKFHQKADFQKYSFELYQVLIQEAMSYIIDPFGDESKQVFIIPHAELHYLPFETLLISEADSSKPYQELDYLLNHCEVSYHYSATLLHLDLQKQSMQAERAPTDIAFTGFAPIYEFSSEEQKQALKTLQTDYATAVNRSESVRSDGTWVPLPHSKIEVETIAQLFEKKGLQSQSFLYETASKSNLEQQIGNSRFVLIAAHGIVNNEYPELSGLILASSGEKEVAGKSPSFEKHGDIWNEERSSEQTAVEDCILNMKEVAMIPMNADLVVLSSCESGIGELHKGEGMMAVNRGFLASGAKNVVSTLFKVNDRASSELTQLLFAHILKGESYTAALQKAKLELLKKEGMGPKAWSGFVLFGTGSE